MAWLESFRWSAREVGASLRHFVRLVAQEDVEAVRGELAELRRSVARLDRAVARIERGGERSATSSPPSRGPGTP